MIRFKTSLLAPAALALMLAGGAVALAEGEDEQPKPQRQSWSFYGRVRHIRPGATAARIPGLQGGVQQLPPAEHSVPHARRIPTVPATAKRRSRPSRRPIRSTNEEPNDKGEMFKRPGTPADMFPPPDAFPNDAGRGRAVRQGAAGHGPARQGAQVRARLPEFRVRHISTPIRKSGPTISTRS